MPDDKRIIRTTLESDARVEHPREIAISCQAGWVVLRGTVATPRQRSVAHEVARSAPGVRGVEVALRVDLRDRWDDGELRGTALQALITDAEVPADRVDVLVANAWPTLKGEAQDQLASDAAFARPYRRCRGSEGSPTRSRSSRPASTAELLRPSRRGRSSRRAPIRDQALGPASGDCDHAVCVTTAHRGHRDLETAGRSIRPATNKKKTERAEK